MSKYKWEILKIEIRNFTDKSLEEKHHFFNEFYSSYFGSYLLPMIYQI